MASSQLSLFSGGWEPFIPVYPGNKRKRKYRAAIFDGDLCWGSIVEPFCGTGSTALYGYTNYRFLGESAPDVRAIWESWLSGQWHKVRESVRFAATLDPQHAWDTAKELYEITEKPVQLAAASLILRKLAFGGVIRHNTQGKLNVTWSSHKVEAFRNWAVSAPPVCPGITLRDSWEGAIAAWQDLECQKSLVVIDPPYWLPYAPGTERRGTGLMTPAYAGHRPHDDETLALCLEPLRQVASNPNAARIVVCNYYSDLLNTEIANIANRHNRRFTWKNFGVMEGLNHNKKQRVQAIERFWILQ